MKDIVPAKGNIDVYGEYYIVNLLIEDKNNTL